MRKLLALTSRGALTWFVPFVVGMFLFTPQGEPMLDLFLTKTLLLLTSASFSAWLLVRWFRTVHRDFVREALLVGGTWLAVNWLLDFAVLLPLSGQPIGDYMAQVGLRYLLLPLMAVAIGASLQRTPSPAMA